MMLEEGWVHLWKNNRAFKQNIEYKGITRFRLKYAILDCFGVKFDSHLQKTIFQMTIEYTKVFQV